MECGLRRHEIAMDYQFCSRMVPDAAVSYHIGESGAEQRQNGEERDGGGGCSMRRAAASDSKIGLR